MKPRVALVLAVLMAGNLAATSSPDGPEVVDGCGDTDTHAAGQGVPHPMPEGTDIDTVDVRDLFVGASEEPGPVDGLAIDFAMCGPLPEVPANEHVLLLWETASTIDECDAFGGRIDLWRPLDTGELHADYTHSCYAYTYGAGPLGIGSSTTLTITERFVERLPASAVSVAGTTITVALRDADLSADARGTLGEGAAMTGLRAFGSSVAGVAAEVHAGPAALVQLTDRASGRDRIVGEDRPAA